MPTYDYSDAYSPSSAPNSGDYYQGPVQQGMNEAVFRVTGTNVPVGDVLGDDNTRSDDGGSSGGSGGGGYDASSMLRSAGLDSSQKSSLFKQYGVNNTPDLLEAIKESEKQRQREYESKVRGEIEKGYSDVFSKLDSMIGLLPTQQGELERRVGEMEKSQLANVDLERERGIASLGSAEQKQRDLAKFSLRDLEDDTRNSMTAAGRYIGTRGAGDSSAVYLASEALARQAQKGRAGVLSTRNQAIGDIQLKIADVNNLASQEKNKVQQWKSNSLLTIAQDFQSRMENLLSQKVNASKEKVNALTNLIADSWKTFKSALSNLDSKALDYAQQIDMWQTQRQAELEDYATKQSISGGYSGPNQSAYTNRVMSLIGQGLGIDAANKIAQGEGLSGSYLSPEMFESGEMSPSEMSGSDTAIYQDMPWVEQNTPPSSFDWTGAGL